MATTKVSALSALTSPDGSEELLVNDGGTSKKLLISNLPVGSLGANTVDSDQYVDGSIDTAHIGDDQVTADKLANSINTDIATGVTAGTTASAALPKAGGAMTGAITTNSTFDGRDVATDGTKLDGIEASADVTDATNVAAAGALMDSEVTNLADVKAFATGDYATAAQGTTADAALPKAGGTMTGDLILGDNVKLEVGSATGGDLQIYHDGSNSYIDEQGTGDLRIRGANDLLIQSSTGEDMIKCVKDAQVNLYYDDVKKFNTTATGISVTGTAVATTDTDATNTGSVTLDFAANQNFVLTLTGNVTLANPSTEQVGQSGFITFIQDGTGSRTVSLGTDYETAGAAGLTLTSTASATDIVPYVVVASGRILLGTPQLAFS